jgi:Antitoxin VbhA
MSPPTPTIVRPPLTDEERVQREHAVSDARVSIELEGLSFSPEAEADNQAWIRGEITIEESIARTKARHTKYQT